MENNIKNQKNSENITLRKQLKKPINITLIRFIACFVLFFTTIFIKLNKPLKFEQIKSYYKNNFCTEKITVTEIRDVQKEKAQLIKNKIKN